MIGESRRRCIGRFEKRVYELGSSILAVLILRREGKYCRLHVEIGVSSDYALDQSSAYECHRPVTDPSWILAGP